MMVSYSDSGTVWESVLLKQQVSGTSSDTEHHQSLNAQAQLEVRSRALLDEDDRDDSAAATGFVFLN